MLISLAMGFSDGIAIFSGFIALLAFIGSMISYSETNKLANKDFLLTHRPFVWVENFGYVDDQKKLITPINEVMIRVLNSPANLIKEYYEYYIIDNNGNKTVLEKQEYTNHIRYPDDKSQYTRKSSEVTEQSIARLNHNQELERIIRIDYSWLSSDKIYFYETKQRLDKKHKTWKIIKQEAN